MTKIRFPIPIFFVTVAVLCSAQTVNQRRANLPTEEQIPENPKFSRAPPSQSKKRKPGAKPVNGAKDLSEAPPAPSYAPLPTPPSQPDQPLISTGELTHGEALASVFHCLKLPPPFEQANISIGTPARILLADPNAYTGSMSPWSGTAIWINKGKVTKEEAVEAPNGWATIRWPSAELGNPDPGSLTIKANRPIIAIESWWSDIAMFGNDIPKLLLRTVPEWPTSPRRLNINRMGYREELIPATIPAALRNPRVAPVLKPFLIRAGKTEDEIKRLGSAQ